jgi:hypothetical protein
MDLRNILNILTENEEEVKPNLPEAMQGNKISDLRKTNAKFNQKGAESTLQPMIDSWKVESLTDFIKDKGFTPTYVDVDKKGEKQVNEYFVNLPPIIDECPVCLGDGYVLDKYTDPIRVCDECLGWGELEDDRPPEQKINRDAQAKVLKLNFNRQELYKNQDEEVYSESEFLGKDGKEPAVKYKDSTEADLADRMFRSKGPKGPDRELADKDEGPNARELRLIKQLSGQTKIDEDELDEVLDAPTRSASNKELQDYLSRTVDKKKLKTDKYKMPYIHRSNIVNKYKKDDDKEPKDDNILATDKQVPIVDPNGQQYDLEKLAADITERPKRILSQNEKMTHGDGTETVFFNIGIPALTGLGYDETKKEFVIINTCPGAGECKTFCYALKGGYVQWSPVSLGQTRKLNFLYNDPSGFFDKLNTEIDLENNKSLVKDDPNVSLAVRWHDAGDFFSDEYLDLSYKLADMHPNVRFYAYTKRADVSGATTDRPPNFLIRFSMGANKSEEKKIDFATTLHAITVPKELFNDLLMKSGSKLIKDAEGGWQWDSPEALDQFKERMMIKYPAIKPNTLITYDEMMKQPLGTGSAFGSRNITPKWNVMVKPGDGDDAANRSDVLGVYNLEH